jgi:hypothetical protein
MEWASSVLTGLGSLSLNLRFAECAPSEAENVVEKGLHKNGFN